MFDEYAPGSTGPATVSVSTDESHPSWLDHLWLGVMGGHDVVKASQSLTIKGAARGNWNFSVDASTPKVFVLSNTATSQRNFVLTFTTGSGAAGDARAAYEAILPSDIPNAIRRSMLHDFDQQDPDMQELMLRELRDES